MSDVAHFEVELSWIKNEQIREFTIHCLEQAPPYFWEVPSSSTGKHHSGWSNGPGGLVKHSKATAYVAKELAPAYSLSDEDADVAIAAAILHDITKYGMHGGKYTTSDHGYVGAMFVHLLGKRYSKGEPPRLQDICKGIANHFGKKFPEDYSVIEELVHVADMVASRKEIKFGFLEETSLIG